MFKFFFAVVLLMASFVAPPLLFLSIPVALHVFGGFFGRLVTGKRQVSAFEEEQQILAIGKVFGGAR